MHKTKIPAGILKLSSIMILHSVEISSVDAVLEPIQVLKSPLEPKDSFQCWERTMSLL
jgi:hypothetical protein